MSQYIQTRLSAMDKRGWCAIFGANGASDSAINCYAQFENLLRGLKLGLAPQFLATFDTGSRRRVRLAQRRYDGEAFAVFIEGQVMVPATPMSIASEARLGDHAGGVGLFC